MFLRTNLDSYDRFRLVAFRGCRRCMEYIPPEPREAAFCRKLYDHFRHEPPEDWVRPDCPLPSPGDPHQRFRHIIGCDDCPHLEELEPPAKKDSRCRLTGRTFNYPWRYDPDYETVLPLDGWAHKRCPLPVTTEPPPLYNPWQDL
jgi:hypothetical protein